MPSDEITNSELPARSKKRSSLFLIAITAFLCGTIGTASWVVENFESTVVISEPLLGICAGANVCVLLAAALYEIFYWRLARRRFAQLLEAVASGDKPLTELSRIPASMRSLGRPVAKIFADWHTARSEFDELNTELQGRVAGRTEALERQLGVLKAKASRDSLTGLFNRRSLEEELPQIVDACRKSKRDMILMMIDVDYFKTLNDTLGHQAGDDLLKSIGQIVRSTVRQMDSAFRFGGDEFVIVLPDSDLNSANALGERLKRLVDGLTKHHRNLNPRPQLSIGTCALSEVPPGTQSGQILAWADQKLYAVKHARPRKSRDAA